jgi:2-C-methyl-D-erythritol 4-phosphate cytidylyltransferase
MQHKNRRDKLGAIIVAAGKSRRMEGVDKLFAPLGGKPLLAWSVDACQDSSLIRQIVLVMKEKDLSRGQKLKEQRAWSKVELCAGAALRQDSVRAGLRVMHDCDWVLVHDGARPFLTSHLIEHGLNVVQKVGAAVAAVPVKDTVKLVAGASMIGKTLERDRLWAAQTPQIFSLDAITRAYQNLDAKVTDDAAAVEILGQKVQLYMGDYRNIKVTTIEDLALARIIARKWKENS